MKGKKYQGNDQVILTRRQALSLCTNCVYDFSQSFGEFWTTEVWLNGLWRRDIVWWKVKQGLKMNWGERKTDEYCGMLIHERVVDFIQSGGFRNLTMSCNTNPETEVENWDILGSRVKKKKSYIGLRPGGEGGHQNAYLSSGRQWKETDTERTSEFVQREQAAERTFSIQKIRKLSINSIAAYFFDYLLR